MRRLFSSLFLLRLLIISLSFLLLLGNYLLTLRFGIRERLPLLFGLALIECKSVKLMKTLQFLATYINFRLCSSHQMQVHLQLLLTDTIFWIFRGNYFGEDDVFSLRGDCDLLLDELYKGRDI